MPRGWAGDTEDKAIITRVLLLSVEPAYRGQEVAQIKKEHLSALLLS